MQPFLAMIMPVSGGGGNYPDNTLPVPPPGWDTFPKPLPPGYPPVAGWPGGLPGGGGFPGQGGPYPDNTLPQPPLGIWGGGNVPYPTPPIYIPPEGSPPPLGIWGPTDPRPGWGLPQPPNVPTHPIVLPPELPEVDGDNRPIDWKTAWTPTTGWVVIGVPSEGTNVPTPSGQSKF